MKHKTHYLLLLFSLIIFYAGSHIYTLGRLLIWFNLEIGAWFFIIAAFLIISFPIAAILETRFMNKTTNVFYDLSVIWMGIMTILFPLVLIGEISILWIPQTPWLVIIAAMAISSYAAWNARGIVVRKYKIKGTKKIRIAVASDVHAGPVHGKRYLQRLVQKIKEQDADMLLLPGDLVDGPGKLPDDILEPLRDLDIPIYYSFGNHEFYVGEREVERVLTQSNITVLRNEAIRTKGITIVGIDDSEDPNQVERVMRNITTKGYTILLYHRPEGLEAASDAGVDLMLSGHTHYGQVFPFTLLVKMRFSRIRGWYESGKTRLFVSTGAGTWGPPMRLASKSELAIIDIN